MNDKGNSVLSDYIKRGFLIFGSISFLINILNITLINFYSPAFSMYYMVFTYLPIRLLNTFLNLTDEGLFIAVSIWAILIDGMFGVILSIVVKKVIKLENLIILLIVIYPIYWVIVALTFKIQF